MNQTGWIPPISQFIHVKILLLKIVTSWKLIVFFNYKMHQFHILHFPNSTGVFTKPTSRHCTKYRFSPDIGTLNPYPSVFQVQRVTCWQLSVFHYQIGVGILYSSKLVGIPLLKSWTSTGCSLNSTRSPCSSLYVNLMPPPHLTLAKPKSWF